MNGAMIYRANNRKLIWLAFACAIAIHLAAIGFAKSKPEVVSATICSGPDVEVTDFPPSEPQQDIDTVLPQDQAQSNEFPETTPRPIRQPKKTPIAAVVRSIESGSARAVQGSSRALTLYAPRPNYPYEARRGGITGSGIAQLTVNSTAGNVIDARMSQSTGSVILDNATLEALRKWRFRSGVAENVDVPITFTLTGVSY